MKIGALFVAFTAYTGVDADYYRAPRKGTEIKWPLKSNY